MRTCEYALCGAEFPEKRLAHRYCSEQCKKKNRAYSKRDKARKCAHEPCVQVFEPRHDFHVFCSKLCKHRSRWRKLVIKPGFREKHNGYTRNYYVKNIEKVKRSTRNCKLKRDCGITLTQKEQRVINQDYKCANLACGFTSPDFNKFNSDHDHRTGRLRGELCKRCNLALGMVADNPIVLNGLIEYLTEHAISDLHMVLTKRPKTSPLRT